MQSFRTELENPLVENDIIELERKIALFRDGKIDDDKFRSLRLARGVYGQRQPGVQMVRIKLPYGKMTLAQWSRICAVSDEYSISNLHLTTRQDVQIHYVSLDRTPELWADLERDSITIREACGNTVRNITASDMAGIDPEEPFDVSPYAHAMFEYFLRRPFCQEMGRKFKIAFSSSERDTALVFMHDLGAIPRVKEIGGQQVRGFKVLIGGGLGAQPHLAIATHEFLEAHLLIPYLEAVLRVFDRYGERNSRHKARIKFLIQKIGIAAFNELVAAEQKAVTCQEAPINNTDDFLPQPPTGILPEGVETAVIANPLAFELWKSTNVVAQKQEGFYAVYVRVPNGNISTIKSRYLIERLKTVIADDVRITINQGLQFRFVKDENLMYIYAVLESVGLAAPGFGSLADVTSCPGTDTCNLGISNSTGIALELSRVIEEEYPEFLYNKDFNLKISGCMNSCGQHGMAGIGFHGSSLKSKGRVLPALQVLVGGGVLGSGEGRISDKVLKVPSKRGPDVVRQILNDYKQNAVADQSFLDYSFKQGDKYYYDLLKPLAGLESLTDEDYVDWGQNETYSTAIGVGECAGVMIDLVAVLILESQEKVEFATQSIEGGAWADAIYHAYAAMVNCAKAMLLQKGVHCNTQAGILSDFDKHYTEQGLYNAEKGFKEMVLQINQQDPTEIFAHEYLEQAKEFIRFSEQYKSEISNSTSIAAL